MSQRLVILSEIIAPYRIPVFNALARHPEIDLHVIFLAESDSGLREWRVYKDEIQFSYQVLPSWRQRIAGHKLLLNRGMKEALRAASPDAILCGGYNYPAAWQALRWAGKNQIPFMAWIESTEQDFRSRKPTIEFLKKRFMRGCSAFVVPGRSSFQYVKIYETLEGNIFVAPNAVDTALFAGKAAAAREEGAKNREALKLPARFFLFVGRLVREKGVFDLLEAYGKLTPDERAAVGLVLVGEGAARAELRRRASRINPGEVQFAGFVQREQLALYYALAESFVFPSQSDPWGLVVNEAMACGLPVISSEAAGCTADLVQDGWNGRVVRRGDTAQLKAAMEELAQNSALRITMGNHSKERIVRYSPKACADGIAEAAISVGRLSGGTLSRETLLPRTTRP
jgi:glycosyltransferase involved in cell wall biosynthesis